MSDTLKSYNIFFSWQTDVNKQILKKFVDDCMEEIKKSNEDTFVLIYKYYPADNTSGSPDIVNLIENDIKNCDIFIADLTTVGMTKEDNSVTNNKYLQNSNVCYELGYASRELPYENIIILTDGNAENLFFDIRQHRISFYKIDKDRVVSKFTNKCFKEEFKSYIIAAINHDTHLRKKKHMLFVSNSCCQICLDDINLENSMIFKNMIYCNRCKNYVIKLSNEIYNNTEANNINKCLTDLDLLNNWNHTNRTEYNYPYNQDFKHNLKILKQILTDANKLANNLKITNISKTNVFKYLKDDIGYYYKKYNIQYIICTLQMIKHINLELYPQTLYSICYSLYLRKINIENNHVMQYILKYFIEKVFILYKQMFCEVDSQKYKFNDYENLFKSITFLFSFSNTINRKRITQLLSDYKPSCDENDNILLFNNKKESLVHKIIYNVFHNNIIDISKYRNSRYDKSIICRFLYYLSRYDTKQKTINCRDLYHQIINLGNCIRAQKDTFEIEKFYFHCGMQLKFWKIIQY